MPATLNQHGTIFGFGPAVLVPKHTDFISGKRWALGPTAVIAKQESDWTYGMLVNHLWSVGSSTSPNISSTFLQPLVSYTTKEAWT